MKCGTIEVHIQEISLIDYLYRERGCWVNTPADFTSDATKRKKCKKLFS